jgi:hypothetical protein
MVPPYDPIGNRRALARKRDAIERIADVLFALDAHLIGDYVSDAVARNRPEDVAVIDATLPAAVIGNAVAVLSVTLPPGVAVDRTSTIDGVTRIYMSIDGGPAGTVTVEIRAHVPVLVAGVVDLSIAFDRQALAMSTSRIYVRTGCGCEGVASVRALLARAREHTFCLVPTFCQASFLVEAASSRLHGRAMRRAEQMVRDGWTMDDALAGKNAWVVSTWAQLGAARSGGGGGNGCRATTTHDECAICQERFAQTDAVANLPCNHNFHVACPASSAAAASRGRCGMNNNREISSGLCGWLDRGNATCPCCRTPAFYTSPLPQYLPTG